jgi:hypothetical protein
VPVIDQIRKLVEERLTNPVLVARMLDRLTNSLTSRRVKEINRVVGRAMNAMPDSKYWTREMPDYQRYLAEYTLLKRRLGLLRKRWVNECLSDEEIVSISIRMSDLVSQVKDARQKARELRDAVWYGHFNQ